MNKLEQNKKGYIIFINNQYHTTTRTKAEAQAIVRELKAESDNLDTYKINPCSIPVSQIFPAYLNGKRTYVSIPDRED